MIQDVSRLGARVAENWHIKTVWSGICTLFSVYLWDQLSPLYAVWFGMYLLDFGTGIAKAVYNHDFSSAGLRRGLVKFVGYSITAGVLALVSNAISDPSTGWLWRWIVDWTLFYIIFMEYVSISENMDVFGVNLPTLSALSDFVDRVKSAAKGEGGNQ